MKESEAQCEDEGQDQAEQLTQGEPEHRQAHPQEVAQSAASFRTDEFGDLLGCEHADQREDEADGEEYGHDNFYRSMRPVKNVLIEGDDVAKKWQRHRLASYC